MKLEEIWNHKGFRALMCIFIGFAVFLNLVNLLSGHLIALVPLGLLGAYVWIMVEIKRRKGLPPK